MGRRDLGRFERACFYGILALAGCIELLGLTALILKLMEIKP